MFNRHATYAQHLPGNMPLTGASFNRIDWVLQGIAVPPSHPPHLTR